MQIDYTNTQANNNFKMPNGDRSDNVSPIANILQMVPYVVKTMSAYDKEGSILSSQIGQKTVVDITASRLTDIFNRKGLLK